MQSKPLLALSLLIITMGIGWLLIALGYGPEIDWIWTLGLAVCGVIVFVISGGVDKVSVVIGTFLLAASTLSILRQTGRLAFNIEVPILVILSGILLLVTQTRLIPAPKWVVKDSETERQRSPS